MGSSRRDGRAFELRSSSFASFANRRPRTTACVSHHPHKRPASHRPAISGFPSPNRWHFFPYLFTCIHNTFRHIQQILLHCIHRLLFSCLYNALCSLSIQLHIHYIHKHIRHDVYSPSLHIRAYLSTFVRVQYECHFQDEPPSQMNTACAEYVANRIRRECNLIRSTREYAPS